MHDLAPFFHFSLVPFLFFSVFKDVIKPSHNKPGAQLTGPSAHTFTCNISLLCNQPRFSSRHKAFSGLNSLR